MVEVAEMSIKGSIDTTLIERGFEIIRQSAKNASVFVQSMFGDFSRLGGAVDFVSGAFVKIAKIGIPALAGLAALSPSVSGSIAKMRIGLFQLSEAAGQQLKPVFESIANNLIPAMTAAIGNNSGAIENFIGIASKLINLTSEIVDSPAFPILLGAAAGFRIGKGPGAVVGAALGAGSTLDFGGIHDLTKNITSGPSDGVGKFLDQKDYAYAFSYFGLTDTIKSRRSLICAGHFDGSTKASNYQDLSKHGNEAKIKKLYFSSTKFFIGFMSNVKRTHTGGRTNFIDYVFGFISPFGILFDDTQQSGLKADADANGGNVPTPIEEITGSVTLNDDIIIKDKDGNGYTLTASATGTLTIKLITLTDIGSDNKFTSYIEGTIGSAVQKLSVATNNKSMLLQLDAAETLNTRFNTGSAEISINTVATNVFTFKFRAGYSSDA